MVKILIVTHGPLANAFKESSEMFFGEASESLATIGLFPSDGPEELTKRIRSEIEVGDTADGVLIFVDMFAGSPFNSVAMLVDELKDKTRIECITGVNMPILMEAMSSKGMELGELVDHLMENANTSILDLRKALNL